MGWSPVNALRPVSRRGAWGKAAAVGLTAAMAAAVAAPPARAADAAPYRAQVLERGYDTAKVVTLTFDADWSDAGVPSVLNTLKANGITAAFSLTGRFVERYPAATGAIMDAGSKLVNHSYDHPYFSKLTQAQRWAELDKAEAAYRRLGHDSGGWFRAPYRDGYADPGLNRDLALRKYYVNWDWTFDTTGYKGVSTATILARVRQYTVPGAIILMHPGEGSSDPAALPQVISTLRGMGYGFTDPFRTVTHGGIGAKYASMGAQRSGLGAARTVEMPASTTGTAVQWFDHGRIYWKKGLPVHWVAGGILTKFLSLGGVTSFLGFPLSDETVVTGGRASQFQGGNVYWSSGTGAHEVHGGILAKYLSLGGSGSRLGLPVSDEFGIAAGRRGNFQHGAIEWHWATHSAVVIYY
ncbi:polysaccharide deacetylase family protein [Streptomyces anandii]|uniref:polysaccharide deacetylase family protein n=1 Tax=Streptomyces anandii TaxID=285454 RepID=UPI00167AB430|nr:polysaccharide deacetylase family protein [Streptomyces anandii]